jgi:hypothetical protein
MMITVYAVSTAVRLRPVAGIEQHFPTPGPYCLQTIVVLGFRPVAQRQSARP